MKKGSFTGRNQLIDRLASQVGSKSLAIEILKKRGHLEEDGKTLTPLGAERNSMTAEERAIDRRARSSGETPDKYSYNPATNKAVIKKHLP